MSRLLCFFTLFQPRKKWAVCLLQPYKILFFIFIVAIPAISVAQVAAVNPPSGGFNIDGTLRVNSAVGDWVQGITGTGGFVLQGTGNPLVWGAVDATTTKFIKDDYDNSADRIFSGSSFGDNPNTWKWTTGKATNKCDISTALFHTTTSATQKWLILGGDRFTTTGTSYIDFQFSQGVFTRNPDGTFSSVDADGISSLAATNGRKVGDFVLSMEYTNGGAIATVHYYRWEASGNTYKFVEKPIPAPGNIASAFGKSNTGATEVPYGAFGSTSYIPFAFVEAAVNIDAILTGNCQSVSIKTIFVSTKASDSYSAALKDFVDPQPVNFVFGSAGLLYPATSFCRTVGETSPTTPASPSGTFTSTPAGLDLDATTGVIDPSNSTAGQYDVTYTPSGGVCVTPTTVTITIHPTPTVNDPSDQSICNNTSTGAVNFSGTVAGSALNWTNNTTSIGLAASGSGNIAAFTGTNSGTSIVTATINVTPSANGCTGTAQSFTIAVKPTPTVTDPSDQILCNGVSTDAVNFTGAVASTTFNWTNNTTSIGLAANGEGNITAFPAVNSGAANVVATVNVTPTANSCAGSAQSFIITVKPTPTVNDPADQTLCSGASTTAVNFTGAVNNTTFNWTNNAISIGLGASGSGNIGSFVSQNPGPSNVTATINVTPTANSCNGAAQSFTITVNANPSTLSASVTQPNCTTTTGTISVTSGTAGLMFSINSSNPADFTDADGIFSGLSAGSYTIRSKNAAGCISSGLAKTIIAAASAPAAGDVSIVSNVSCSSSTGTLRVVVAATGSDYTADFEISENGTNVWYEHDHVFTFIAGAGYHFTVRRKTDHTCTTSVNCAGEQERVAINTSTSGQSSRIINSSSNETTEAQTTVKAFPNPFNDRIKFVVSVPQPGYGSLEVMNMLGQKVKTIFQGQLKAGDQSFEMVLPQSRYSTLFYIFRINGKQVSGKLIQRN